MQKLNKKIYLWVLDLAINIAIIFVLVIVIQKWIIAPFDVHGASMCDTMNFINGECHNDIGEKIIINEALYLFNDPERGDIVVFNTEDSGDKFYIKRVIGLPGETIEIKDGEVYLTTIEGEIIQLDEPYLNIENKGNTKVNYTNVSIFEVPEEHYFLLGDNRKGSTDSRTCFTGGGTTLSECKKNPTKAFIHEDNIRGKAAVVWWPLSNIRLVEDFDYSFEEETEETLEENQDNSESLEEK